MQPSPAPSPATQLCSKLRSSLETIKGDWGRYANGDLMACEVFADPGEKAKYRNGVLQGISKTLTSADDLLLTVERRGDEIARLSALQRELVIDALKKALDSCERFNQLRSGPSRGFTAGLVQAEAYGASKLDTPEGWEVLAGVDAARERAAFTFDPTQIEASCANNNLLMEKLLLVQSALLRLWETK